MRTPISQTTSESKDSVDDDPRKSHTRVDRIKFTETDISIWGYPSRGGVIVLDDATHVDFIFLGLSTTNPASSSILRRPDLQRPVVRPITTTTPNEQEKARTAGTYVDLEAKRIKSASDSKHDSKVKDEEEEEEEGEENTFCQHLLLLGATWWDSSARYRFVDHFSANIQPFVDDVENGQVPPPTLRERRWVKVGIEQQRYDDGRGVGDGRDGGGFWILDRDHNWPGIIEPYNLVPVDAARLRLARSMEERCVILKGMGAKFYRDLEDYNIGGEATTFVRAWEWKWGGEVGELS